MSDVALNLSRFTPRGLEEFAKWIAYGAQGLVPLDLLADKTFASHINGGVEVAPQAFATRYDFGRYLADILMPLDRHAIAYDRGLWSWLAAAFFEQIAPRDASGQRHLRRPYAYILEDRRKYYRHLVRTPWYLVATHGERCRYLLLPDPRDEAPLSRQRDLLEALAARQSLIASPTLIDAAGKLYIDVRTGAPKRGFSSKRGGSPRRLALIANQLALTHDIHNMPVDRFLDLLPEEFGIKRTVRA